MNESFLRNQEIKEGLLTAAGHTRPASQVLQSQHTSVGQQSEFKAIYTSNLSLGGNGGF